MNKEIEALFSRPFVTRAAHLYVKNRFAKRVTIPWIIISLGIVFASTWGSKISGQEITTESLITAVAIIGMLWVMWGYAYLKTLRRILTQLKPLLDQKVKLELLIGA